MTTTIAAKEACVLTSDLLVTKLVLTSYNKSLALLSMYNYFLSVHI